MFLNRVDFRRRVEEFAPETYRAERNALFSELPDTIVELILFAIVTATAFRDPRRSGVSSTRPILSRKTYRERMATLKDQVHQIAKHPLVRWVRPDAVEFYSFEDVYCPHERRRKDCERIRDRLELVYFYEQLAERVPVSFFRDARATRLIHSLEREGIHDPKNEPLKNYCARTVGRLAPSVEKSRGGRPPKNLQKYLVEVVVPLLTNAGVTIEKSCEYVQRILQYCFGEEVDAEALAKMWRRREKEG